MILTVFVCGRECDGTTALNTVEFAIRARMSISLIKHFRTQKQTKENFVCLHQTHSMGLKTTKNKIRKYCCGVV